MQINLRCYMSMGMGGSGSGGTPGAGCPLARPARRSEWSICKADVQTTVQSAPLRSILPNTDRSLAYLYSWPRRPQRCNPWRRRTASCLRWFGFSMSLSLSLSFGLGLRLVV